MSACSTVTRDAVAGAAELETQRKPNVIFFLIDDMGYADLSCFGQKKIQTPNIDRMASEGIKFTQYYVNAPICSPSRTAVMTGQYPARWKITSFLEHRQSNTHRGMAQWLDVKAPTVAKMMKDAGYTTGHFGKWHMGGQRDVGEAPLVTEYGFDKSITSFEGLGDRYLPLLDKFDGSPVEKMGLGLGSEKLGRGNITWIDRSKITSAWRDRAIEFIEDASKSDKPFYVDIWPDDVHSPFFPPEALRKDKDLNGQTPKENLYLGVVKALDDQMVKLFDTVRNDPKLRDNTIIIIASDNGPEPGAGSAGPYKGHKGNLFEGGVREPFIVWAPGFQPKEAVGTVDEKTVIAGMDLLPSIAALTHTPVPDAFKPDGEDRSAAMLGKAMADRKAPIFWIRPPDRPGPKAEDWPDLSERDGNWKLTCSYEGTDVKLFDLASDIKETTDVAGSHKEIVDRMKPPLMAWFATLPPPPKMARNAPNGDQNGG